MQPVMTAPQCRLLRPLLGIEPDALRRYLTAIQQPWIEDPSNQSPDFMRVRIRQVLPSMRASGLDLKDFHWFSTEMQQARRATDDAVAACLATCVTVHGAGYGEIDLPCLRQAPLFVAAKTLARLITAVGGRQWEPPGISRLLDQCRQPTFGKGTTLGRCRIFSRGGRLLVCRERRNLPPPQPLASVGTVHWDGRFELTIETVDADRKVAASLWLRPLGLQSLESALAPGTDLAATRAAAPSTIPKEVWPTLPVISDGTGVVQAPHLGYIRAGWRGSPRITRVVFLPRRCAGDSDSIIA